ncbi:RluA family pseudouridine synthase [Pelagibaculum spongiae]|uniref:Dual-specificity RNA pseudouridine synthase RluA n=1 Tax=Pelagibaculum spongiae TaxID=2080658 RepID=A0A2V1GTI8_9GAMM|nr:RluA family pseudouridine synthase [Pelagibaculum spongiae]PVZ66330.1 RNA pseudouridine synthase [Pelagibaculum spongiae]
MPTDALKKINADDFVAPECKAEIEVLYQDDDILVINKPSGLLSLSGKNPKNLDSVHYRLRQLFPTCTMIHRLDLGTSGIMLLALNKPANKQLCHQFSHREVSKRYIAMLAGQLELDAGVIDLPIIKDEFPRHKVFVEGDNNLAALDSVQQQNIGNQKYQKKAPSPKPAQSRYQVIKRFSNPDSTLVEFEPITGRTHQLRIHSQAIDHSILGCDLYASSEVHALAPRLMLHASELSFHHPVSGETMHFVCPARFHCDEHYCV